MFHTTALALSLALPVSNTVDELAPIPGTILLASEGEASNEIAQAFMDSAGGGPFLLLSDGEEPWLEVPVLALVDEGSLTDAETLTTLLGSNGLWIHTVPNEVWEAPLFATLLITHLERGGVLGADGESARTLAAMFAPRLHLEFGVEDVGNKDQHHHAAVQMPGRIVAALPAGTALALSGREVGLVGKQAVGFALYGVEDEPLNEQVFTGGGVHAYRLDWLTWVRQARDFERQPFPPQKPATPRIANGTLIVQGGGGVTDATWERFIEEAGGKEARFVCIPSAGDVERAHAPDSYSARELRERGCQNITILHAAHRRRANHTRFVTAIDEAHAVWIDGGRTFRFMDRFEDTLGAKAIARLLERGGVVGGSSAGCQVVGEMLVRGNPRTNQDLLYPGYMRGLGLLPGVVFDAHFLQRERGPEFSALVRSHPQMLGLGLDVETALLIQGNLAEVLGLSLVSLYDGRKGAEITDDGIQLRPGDLLDLVSGEVARVQ